MDADPRLEEARALFAALAAAHSGATPALAERLERAFGVVPREAFIGAGPWTIMANRKTVVTPSPDPIHLYQDVLVAIDTLRRINNGEPFLHARLLAALAPHHGETALHIGCGTGYYTAILATLVTMEGSVIGYEIAENLAAMAKTNLAPWRHVKVVAASGVTDPLPASDLIYVSASASSPMSCWLDALNEGGRLLFPLTGPDGFGVALLVTRQGEQWAARVITKAAFIGCSGAMDIDEAHAIAPFLQDRRVWTVRSLRRNEPADATAVLRGRGWWLSDTLPTAV